MANMLQQLLARVTQQLVSHSETPSLDAQVLLAHVLGKPRSWVLAHPEVLLDKRQAKEVSLAVDRLQLGEPLPYVIGHWEFFGLDFDLTPAVLIPRPDTELLVENALTWLRDHPSRSKVIDVGAGSGCIGIALAVNNPDLHVLLTDASALALDVALKNAEKHGVSAQLAFQQANLLDGVADSFDLLCANLPYIPTSVLMGLPVSQREPLQALDGGPDGLCLIIRLLDQARDHLMPGGSIFLEIEASQGLAVRKIAQDFYPAATIQVLKDLSGHDRCVQIIPSGLIVHLCSGEEWLQAQKSGVFIDDSLDQAGFIHCSRPDQLLQVANRYFRQVHDMKVLWVDPWKVRPRIRWETADGASFPHIYGPIDLSAVTAVTELRADADGYYRLIELPGYNEGRQVYLA